MTESCERFLAIFLKLLGTTVIQMIAHHSVDFILI